jgi:hypothetical protein
MPTRPKKYHFIYKTTCIKTGKFYIGMHSTDRIEDGYIGSGQRLWHSINYHGKENHKIEILEFCQDRESLALREREIVNEDLLENPKCMNLCLGGETGFTEDQRSKGAISSNQKNWKDPIYAKKMKEVSSEVMKKLWQDPESSKRLLEGAGKSFKGKKHTEEAKKTIGDKISKAQKAEKNSQFGTCWINNPIEKTNRKIKKEEIKKYLQEGWESGMKMDFFKR